MKRQILHLDLDAFFCAVEELHQPHLRGKPFAVGGSPQERGVVASCSYPARMFGVRSAMPMSRALQLCPDLIVVDKHFGDYQATSKRVMAILRDCTPLIEQISIDEAFLDVSDLGEEGEVQAYTLQAKINYELGLPCSLGVAGNKLVAKIANNMGKDRVRSGKPPNTVTVVPHGEEATFLAPLPTRELWGVGPKTAEKLAGLNIHTIGELAAFSSSELVRLFGKHGEEMAQHARGIDERPIVTEYETKSISREITFTRDEHRTNELESVLREMAGSVAETLHEDGLHGQTIKIKLRWSDFTTLTRQVTLPYPTDNAETIYNYAVYLLHQHRPQQRPVRLIGVGISGLTEDLPMRQLSLWD